MKRGFVYILTNPAIPDLVKIGKTTRLSSNRAREIESEFRSITGLPYGFRVAYDWEVADCDKAERFIHLQLSDRRTNKEWFELSLRDAIDRVGKLILDNGFEYTSHVNIVSYHLRRAEEAFEKNEFEEAVNECDVVLRKNPANEDAIAHIAVCKSCMVLLQNDQSLDEIVKPLEDYIVNYSSNHSKILYYLCANLYRSNLWNDLEGNDYNSFCEN